MSHLSEKRKRRIRAQGYFHYSDREINDLAIGNRFAYQLCTSFLILGMVTMNWHILAMMCLVALLAILLPFHPFDYIYNFWIAGPLGRPVLPPRSKQLKFACTIASVWLAVTVFFTLTHQVLIASFFGYSLIGVALLVSLFDLCIPSEIYNTVVSRISKTRPA